MLTKAGQNNGAQSPFRLGGLYAIGQNCRRDNRATGATTQAQKPEPL